MVIFAVVARFVATQVDAKKKLISANWESYNRSQTTDSFSLEKNISGIKIVARINSPTHSNGNRNLRGNLALPFVALLLKPAGKSSIFVKFGDFPSYKPP